jgi:hypothetical protein
MNKIQYIYFIYIPNEVCSCEIPIDVGMRGLIGSGTFITHCDKKNRNFAKLCWYMAL